MTAMPPLHTDGAGCTAAQQLPRAALGHGTRPDDDSKRPLAGLTTASSSTSADGDSAVAEKQMLQNGHGHGPDGARQSAPPQNALRASTRPSTAPAGSTGASRSHRGDAAGSSVSLPMADRHRHDRHLHDPVQPPGLPQLNYNLWDHRKKLVLMAGLLMAEFCFIPVALYYPLWYRTTLRHGILFAIITSFFGIITGIEFAVRSWRLLQRAPTYRPIGGRRWGLDATHWILSTVYSLMTALLIGASIPTEPLVRPLALPSTIFLFSMAILHLGTGVLHHRGAALRWQFSSVPPGGRVPPLTYTLVEDVVAVDGGAGLPYRERLAARWRASRRFRLLLTRLNWFWGVGTLAGGAMTMTVLWTTSRDVAYGFGWAGPLVVVCLLAAATVHIVRVGLRREKELWATDRQPS